MILTVFQSEKGDCLLVTAGSGHQMLVDGGMRASFTTHVSPALGALHRQKKKLDLVYVSHIDEDHISGVLQLMDDLVAWRVHEFHVKNGNPGSKPPTHARPPEVKAIWHNAFHEQVGKNAGEIGDMLAAMATVLAGTDEPSVKRLAARHGELATSTAQAIQLSRRVGPNQLNIALNADFQGGYMYVRQPPRKIRLGSLSIFVIGPFESELRKLRKEWNDWLKDNRERLRSIQARAKADEARLASNEVERILIPAEMQAAELGRQLQAELAQAKKVLGRREKVTTPNLASLMLLVEENGKKVLLTGDGHWEDILKGLDHHGKRDASGGLHVDVLKVQHHGAEHNIKEEFAKAVTADHYVFCGNGAHANPDLDAVEVILNSRIGSPSQLSANAQAGRPFKLWFNSSSSIAGHEKKNRDHMKKIERLVRQAAKTKGEVKYAFLTGHKMVLAV